MYSLGESPDNCCKGLRKSGGEKRDACWHLLSLGFGRAPQTPSQRCLFNKTLFSPCLSAMEFEQIGPAYSKAALMGHWEGICVNPSS